MNVENQNRELKTKNWKFQTENWNGESEMGNWNLKSKIAALIDCKSGHWVPPWRWRFQPKIQNSDQSNFF